MMGRSRATIGILTPYTGGFYHGAVLAGVQSVARARGARVVALQTVGLDLMWPEEPGTQPLSLNAVDGWIVANEVDQRAYLEAIIARGQPLVALSHRPHDLECCAVLPDNFSGAKQSTRHLIDHGHTRIAFAGALDQFDLRERYEGYLEAHREAGLAVDDALCFLTNNNLELDGRELGHHLDRIGLPCQALVAGTDKIALGVLSVLHEHGYQLPRDLCLVGFDDIEKAQYADPPLSTVRQRFELIGTRATETLLSHLLDRTPLPWEVRVPTALVVRKSCGCNPIANVPSTAKLGTGEAAGRALGEVLLAAAQAQHLSPVSPSMWPGAQRIADHLAAVARGEPDPGPEDLTGVWRGFLDVNRDVESLEAVMALLEESARALLALQPPDPAHAHDLQLSVRRLRVELMRGWRVMEQERSRYYDFVAEANGKIGQALSGTAFATAKNLEWLTWTRIHYGCLGLWEADDTTAPRTLRIIGEYGADPRSESLIETSHAPEHFPPKKVHDLLERSGLDDVLIIVPIVGSRDNRGLLMLAGPVEVELCDHVGSIGDWAALVATSLEREEVEQELKDNAFRDALTGLPNRALLIDRLEQVLAAAQLGPGRRFAVLFLDLDDFKSINDSLGHIAGDQLLVEVARRLRGSMRATETVARLGGDEFAVVVPDVSHEDQILEVVARIQEALRPVYTLNENPVFTSCSVGIAFGSDPTQRPEDLLRNADTAMYRAKFKGRAGHEIFDSGMHALALERLQLDSRLRHALERGEFLLHYQPLISLTSGRTVGAEALIRWNHPERGCLSPARFLSIAEEVGLAIPISRWVIQTACREARAWQIPDEPPRYVTVNVPAQHLKDPGFVDFVQQELERFELPPEALGLELVEGTLIEGEKSTIRTLSSLRELGVRTAIDDFGTGYSALSYLKRFPVSVLKIDRAFIHGIPLDPYDTAIARSIITLAHDLRLNVVAEGVETEAQLAFLRLHGCDVVQGFLLSRPLPAPEMERFLEESERAFQLLERIA